MKVRIKCLKN